MPDYNLEYALNELSHAQANLDLIRWHFLSEMRDDQPLAGRDRDAISGAITAMGWAVDRAVQAWEADWDAKHAGEAQNEQAA